MWATVILTFGVEHSNQIRAPSVPTPRRRSVLATRGEAFMHTKILAFVLAGLAVACVQKGSTTETTSVADLKSYKACAVQLDETGMKNGPKAKQVVMEQLRSKMSADGTCEVKDDGDLVLKIKGKLEEVKDLGMGGSGLAGKDFEAQLDVELVEAGSNKALGSFSAKGNTKENAKTTVGGVDTGTMAGEKESMALKRAADQVAEFMKSKRK